MKWIIGLSFLVFFFAATSFSPAIKSDAQIHLKMMPQDTTFDVALAIASIKEKIKGREQEPSSEVYENVQLLGQIPAGRLMAIMEYAFNGSLGVKCNHCHNPHDWASDEKSEKQITRDMWKMVGTINQSLLGSINNLKGSPPTINCTTCHRGDIVPKLSLN